MGYDKKMMGDIVRNLRELKKMTQAELAEAVGYKRDSQTFIASIEKGRRSIPRHKLRAFAEALDIDPADLI